MKKLKITLIMALFASALISALAACNTIHGVGKDIEGGGRAIQKASH